ncbi:hypothetical protein KC19_5G121100 [Ceratodon purpureus]|uniref:PsbP C-terminal domain-containing protein n=1 Tax=Ceratodon purpureus TaxID=3225 RepID=A0A8T0I325_CERPU|nr:hypothetical protein KC19_5G121100 [Ceratodon purpureus]
MAVTATVAMSSGVGIVKASPGSSFRVGVSVGGCAVRKVVRFGVVASVGKGEEVGDAVVVSRRVAILGGLVAGGVVVSGGGEVRAAVPTYRKYVDRLDGYAFSYPAGWIQVRGAGADVFFRDPVNLDENLLVEMSSPSSSKFQGVEDLGTPEQAAKKVLQQQLTEFMSTRIGVRREANVTATRSRVGDDGRLYYEVEVTASSFANNNQLAVMPGDRVAKLEWSRRYLSVLGVENNRLYQLRLQVPENVADLEQQDLRQIMESFKVLKLEA